mmetsp:Transcript_17942/g.28981  ORF Transcript_17942/g.28981 Transcript_17942/m.28981 type:complete len:239 (+) Transcript_17942:74-790(+)
MKLSVVASTIQALLAVFTFFVHVSPSVGDCANEYCVGNNDDRCDPQLGGYCTEATKIFVQAYLTGKVTPQTLAQASAQVKYGKYCGLFNRCSKLEPPFCFDPPAPCDDIDDACADHDDCLDDAIEALDCTFDPQGGCDIAFVDRFMCDAKLVAMLAKEFNSGCPTGLCDNEFYQAQEFLGGAKPIDIVQHESMLMAGPFCLTTVVSGCQSPVADPSLCAIALPFCSAFADALNSLFAD